MRMIGAVGGLQLLRRRWPSCWICGEVVRTRSLLLSSSPSPWTAGVGVRSVWVSMLRVCGASTLLTMSYSSDDVGICV